MINKLRCFSYAFLLSIMALPMASADVWKHEKEWAPEHEVAFVKWIASEAFNRRIFTDPKSPYANLPTDCADVVYASRIIFAYENKLNFKSFSPTKEDGNFWKRTISNSTNLFDNYKEGPERVKAFITYLGKFSDTKFLAEKDSFPIALKDIRPGDFYITEQRLNEGTTIRHTYVVKKVYSSGIFDLYYSTLPYMVRELKFHRGLPLFPFSKEPFGFRRFIPPYNLATVEKDLPGFSLEQFELLKSVGEDNVLSAISQKIRTEEEGLNGRLERLLGNLCRSMDDRIEAVNESIRFVKSIDNRCVSRAEFNNLSTPVKDQRIQSQIKVLSQFWRAVNKEKRLADFSEERIKALNFLTDLPNGSEAAHKKLCQDYPQIPLTLKDFNVLYEQGKISSHPNDSIDMRWGKKEGIPTECQSFY